jgi:segregation and condensation protein B
MSEIDPGNIVEALLFASSEPLGEAEIQAVLGGLGGRRDIHERLRQDYAGRGGRLERHVRGWALRTDPELAPYLTRVVRPARRLSKAALEALAIVAYQQPVTRAEIEAVRGVTLGKGTLDVLVEAGFVAPRGRRDTLGRPVTWVTTPAFLDHFGLASLADLPRLEELEAAGLFASGEEA